jgi:nicotinamidase-related amidase
MPAKNRSLHGNAPDKSEIALLLIDVINDFDFPEAEQLLCYAVPMAERISELKSRAKQAGVPVIYANDNFGRWRSDFQAIVDHCIRADCRGRRIAELLKPESDDYFVLKPKHSGFYSTTLDLVLRYLEVRKVILTGVATNICVLFTANDAYMRDYELFVPQDCVAANTEALNRQALEQIEFVLKADIRVASKLDFDEAAKHLYGVSFGPNSELKRC